MRTIDSTATCLFASCIVGILIGLLFLTEPKAIDGALVVAGVVNYPPSSAQGIYFYNMWTAIHQVLGLLLWAGIPQTLVAAGFCAALGASYVAGAMLVTLALTGRAFFSLLIALAIVLCGFFVRGPDYPINFFFMHSFGQTALSLSVLAIGLFGNRWYISAGFFAAILPAFHPVSGCWTAFLILLGGVFLLRNNRNAFSRLLRGFTLGFIVTLVSFGYFWLHRVSMSPVVDPTILKDFLEYWDYHRHVPYTYYTAFITSVCLILLWVILDHAKRTGNAKLLGISFLLLVSAAGSWLLYEVVHRLHDQLPAAISGAMLGRLVNIHYELVLPICLGAILTRRHPVLPILGLPFIFEFYVPRSDRNWLLVCAVLATAFFFWKARRVTADDAGKREFIEHAESKAHILALIVVTAFIVHSLRHLDAGTPWECSIDIIDDCRPPAIFREISGMHWDGLTAAPAGLAMLTHRHGHKPVLLGASGFDFVPYLPSTGSQVKEILEQVYGQDFRAPLPEYRNQGNLMQGMGQEYWSSLSREEWRTVSEKFCIGAVVAPAEWLLSLEPARYANGVKLYLLQRPGLEKCQLT